LANLGIDGGDGLPRDSTLLLCCAWMESCFNLAAAVGDVAAPVEVLCILD